MDTLRRLVLKTSYSRSVCTASSVAGRVELDRVALVGYYFEFVVRLADEGAKQFFELVADSCLVIGGGFIGIWVIKLDCCQEGEDHFHFNSVHGGSQGQW
jgi:hypothetical protein